MLWIKITIAVLAVVGGALLYLGWRTGKSNDMDAAASAIIPSVLGIIVLAADALLLFGFALYKLFS